MPEQLPKVEESTKFNFVTSIWIVPFIALIIAGWLAYQYFSELGPEIRIVFPSNQGLKAGQSQIKYKDVPVGTITKITLQKDGEGVVVIARMDKVAEPYLNEDTKFWIVKPELGISGITGLDTLISGNYIGITGRKGGELKKSFVGLDHAYRSEIKGEYYVLRSLRGDSSIKQGTPVYLKNIRVGRVEYVMLGLNDIFVDVIIFIDKQYTPYVHTDSKFWVRSTLDAELVNGALDVTLAPFIDLLQGAIEFSSSGYDANQTVPSSFKFLLHRNKNVVNTKKIGHAQKEIELFMLNTEESIAKLKIGSPVKYDGFKIGSVIEITLSYDKKTHKMKGKVITEIDTSVFDDLSDVNDTGKENLYHAVTEGLRARIDTIDPITGRLYVNLLFTDNDGNKTIEKVNGQYAVIPTVHSVNGDMMAGFSKIMDKINRLPIEELVASLNKVIKESEKPVANANVVLEELKETVKNLNALTSKKTFTSMPDEVDKALKELTRTLKTTKKVVKGYGNNSLLSRQIAETLKTVNRTSEEMREFLKMLNRKPNSLIFGDK
jgi:paraquat-inducible protein B